MKKIILTGGGTAGHVTPNIALLPLLQEAGYDISYIGSYNGMEKSLIESHDIPYYGISSGKLRRYLDIKNLSDPFRVIKGYREAVKLMRSLQPDIVFSKGGFVTVPVVLAAHRAHIPVVIHESDMTPGLANRIAIPSATKVCCNFPETVSSLPSGKAELTGSPIREALLHGDAKKGKEICGFVDDKPVIMAMGGSLGAVAINNALREALPALLKDYNVIHLCGDKNIEKSLYNLPGYHQMGHAKDELPHLFALADALVSRAGANSICEFLALSKPNLLIPLPAESSRGDQILNAKSFMEQGYSMVLQESDLTVDSLVKNINELFANKETFISAMTGSATLDAAQKIVNIIESIVENN